MATPSVVSHFWPSAVLSAQIQRSASASLVSQSAHVSFLSLTSKQPGMPVAAESFRVATYSAAITTESLSVSVKYTVFSC